MSMQRRRHKEEGDHGDRGGREFVRQAQVTGVASGNQAAPPRPTVDAPACHRVGKKHLEMSDEDGSPSRSMTIKANNTIVKDEPGSIVSLARCSLAQSAFFLQFERNQTCFLFFYIEQTLLELWASNLCSSPARRTRLHDR